MLSKSPEVTERRALGHAPLPFSFWPDRKSKELGFLSVFNSCATECLTGQWQVTARKNPTFETCMQLDVSYIYQWSLLLDFKILLQTIPAVLSGEGQ